MRLRRPRQIDATRPRQSEGTAPQPTGAQNAQGGTLHALTRLISAIATAIFVVTIPILLVTTNVRVLVSDSGYYKRGLREHEAALRTGIETDQLDRAADEIVRYFENDARDLRLRVIAGGQEQPLFSQKEVDHMRDVKRVVRGAFAAQEASLVYVLAYLGAVVLWARERRIRALCWQVLGGIGLGGAFAAAIGALALSGFDRTWDCFHEIAFRNDLWRLDPDTDRLIQMFPEPFWQEATFLTAGVTAAEALVLAALCGLYLAFGRRGGRQAGP